MGRVLFADAGSAEVEVKSRVPKLVAAVFGIALLVGGSLFAWRAGWLDVEEHRSPVDISDLLGPRDVVPALLSGMPPPAPEDSPVLPTILCRVVLDPRGTVYEVRVFHPRSGLDAFEEAAVAAVRQYGGNVIEAEVVEPIDELELYERIALDTVNTYRFTVGEREGVPVAAWIPWSVLFQ